MLTQFSRYNADYVQFLRKTVLKCTKSHNQQSTVEDDSNGFFKHFVLKEITPSTEISSGVKCLTTIHPTV